MVHYAVSDVISIAEFEFAWRINEPEWPLDPAETMKRIKPLSAERCKQLLEISPRIGGRGCPFDPQRFHAVADVSLEDSAEENCKRVTTWLRQLPIPTSSEVYLCWHVGEGVVAVTDWDTFVEVWSDVWYPFDSFYVVDDSQDWALLLGPEEHAVFIHHGPVDPQLPETDPAYGMSLLMPSGS